MALDVDLINDVLKHCDIVDIISRYIEVKQKGRSFIALCPFHDDKNPSMQISKEKQIFKCFVCGSGGNAIKFVEMYEHISFFEAMQKVAELSGYSDPRLNFHAPKVEKDPQIVALEKCINDLTAYYDYALATQEGKEGLDYFENRNLDENIRRKFLLGYAFKDGKKTCKYLESKGNSLKSMELIGIANTSKEQYSDVNAGRVIFPICDHNGQVVGFSARRLKEDGSPKYVNSPETKLFHKSSVLYNYHHAKETAKKDGYVYILEGFMDIFALEKIGIHSCVALMGTAFTNDHLNMLRSLGVELRFCLDGDDAGQMAEMRVCDIMKGTGIQYQFVSNQGSNKDPDEILNQDGAEALKAYLNNLLNPADFIISYYEKSNKLVSIEDKKQLIARFLPILVDINSRLEFNDYLLKLSKVTKFDAESIRQLVIQAKNKKEDNPSVVLQTFHPERKLIKRLELAEREILFYMLKDVKAVDFYETNVESFYDAVYRRIAEYILDFYKEHQSIDVSSLIASIEAKQDPQGDDLIKEITDLSFEKNHPKKITNEYLDGVFTTISEEKEKLYNRSLLEKMQAGKSDLERARILKDWNERRQILEQRKKEKKGS